MADEFPEDTAPPDDDEWEHVDDGPLRVVISVDVEEEGLFSGSYARQGACVGNVRLLRRLAPLSRELELPLTLLCAHSVFADADACDTLEYMRDHAHAEIGAHLHHWNTPPLPLESSPPSRPPERTHTLPRELLRDRLRTLLAAGRDFQGAPLTSFRMGRWDLKAAVRPLLAEEGILVDSSICPLRVFWGRKDVEEKGADHFLAPADPYWPADADGCSPLLEAPITQVPASVRLSRLWHAAFKSCRCVDNWRFFGAFSPNPVWHGDWVMRMAARLHFSRGGRVLQLFLHSSELLPGGSPNVPDQAAADRLLARIGRFLRWLRRVYSVEGATLSALYALDGFPVLPYSAERDW